jgi:hypothetical protein
MADVSSWSHCGTITQCDHEETSAILCSSKERLASVENSVLRKLLNDHRNISTK